MMSGSVGEAGETTALGASSAVGHKVIGAKHLRDGRPCQDDIRVVQEGDVTVVAVADGHGSCVHADVGARLAVEVAVAALRSFVADLGPEHRADVRAVHAFAQHPLRVQIVREWAQRVRETGGEGVHLTDYGSTLIFVAASPEFVLVGQLGDGDILVVDAAGAVSRPIPADPSSFGEETLSLCLPEAWSSLRVLAMPRPDGETLVLVSTDGYGKSYPSDREFERIGPDYLEMVREIGLAGVAEHLEEFLTTVTRGGSGDDIAFGLLHIPGESRPAAALSVETGATEGVETAPVVEAAPTEPGGAPDAPSKDESGEP